MIRVFHINGKLVTSLGKSDMGKLFELGKECEDF
jgi:hypothetical protein